MRNRQCTYLYIGISIFCFVNSPALAQQSLIDSVIDSKKSVVFIKAIKTEALASPKAAAAVNPKTGRIVISRRIKAAQLEKSGAGIIISSNGLIVANLHTVIYANKVAVKLFNNKTLGAKILHILPEHDLALLKVSTPLELPRISFANSNSVNLGDEVIHIGSSDELRETISGGLITAIGKSSIGTVEVIQVNIPIYKGDSGGPLLNTEGKLIGIMVAKNNKRKNASYAIPSNKIQELYLEHIK